MIRQYFMHFTPEVVGYLPNGLGLQSSARLDKIDSCINRGKEILVS